MHRTLALLLVIASALGTNACGDGGDRSWGAASRAQAPVGGFDAGEVNRFNAAVADYNGAVVAWQARMPDCRAEARRLIRRHATRARALRCHRAIAVDVVRAVGALERDVARFEGTWSRDCAGALTALRAFLTRYDAAWRAVLADWNRIVAGGDADVKGDVITALDMGMAFADRRLPDAQDACMSRLDADEGHLMAARAAEAAESS